MKLEGIHFSHPMALSPMSYEDERCKIFVAKLTSLDFLQRMSNIQASFMPEPRDQFIAQLAGHTKLSSLRLRGMEHHVTYDDTRVHWYGMASHQQTFIDFPKFGKTLTNLSFTDLSTYGTKLTACIVNNQATLRKICSSNVEVCLSTWEIVLRAILACETLTSLDSLDLSYHAFGSLGAHRIKPSPRSHRSARQCRSMHYPRHTLCGSYPCVCKSSLWSKR